MWNLCSFLYGRAWRISRQALEPKKMDARWLPRVLTGAQKKQEIACSEQLLNTFGPDEPERVCDTVTGDGTWISFYSIPNKLRLNQIVGGRWWQKTSFLGENFRGGTGSFFSIQHPHGFILIDCVFWTGNTYYHILCVSSLNSIDAVHLWASNVCVLAQGNHYSGTTQVPSKPRLLWSI